MENKTAMQQMQEWVKTFPYVLNKSDIEAKIKELLATERQQQLEFGKWLSKSGWTPYHLNMWEHPSDEIASTETLYESYYEQTFGNSQNTQQ